MAGSIYIWLGEHSFLIAGAITGAIICDWYANKHGVHLKRFAIIGLLLGIIIGGIITLIWVNHIENKKSPEK